MPKLSPDKRSFTYELPFPPSMNNYWHSRTHPTKGYPMVYISPKGKKFREEVMACVRKVANTNARLTLTLDLACPDRRDRDLDNYVKPTQDALKYARVYTDDKLIDHLHVNRLPVDPLKIGKCIATITEL